MARFGHKSMNNVTSLERDIQIILMEAIKYFDFSVVGGKRTPEEQNDLWAKGRTLKDNGDPRNRDHWKVTMEKDIVTRCDGYGTKSNHQAEPKGKAVDIVPFPSMWTDKNKQHELAGVIKVTQERLLQEGKITSTLEWGFELWGWDLPHFQLRGLDG